MGFFKKILGGADETQNVQQAAEAKIDPRVKQTMEEVRVQNAGETHIPLGAFINACEAREVTLSPYMFEGCDLSDTILMQADIERLGGQLSVRRGTKLNRCIFDASLTYEGLLTDNSTSMIGAVFQGLDATTHLVISAGNISHARFEGAMGAQLEIGRTVIAHNIDMQGAKLAKLIVEPGADLSGANFSHARIVEFKTMMETAA